MAIMPIERGKIREYATATAAARPAYLDDPKAPVPPTFLATVVFWTPIGETLRSPEVLRACAAAVTELVPGDRLPERTFGPVTMTDIVRYQGASGDMNPIHHDDEFARAAGFPAAISVGMLGAGWLAAYCTEHLGEETVRRFRTRFSQVVYRGDRLTASAEVVSRFERDGEPRVELAVTLRKDDGCVAVSGTAEFAVSAGD